jgi:hypothetical protein
VGVTSSSNSFQETWGWDQLLRMPNWPLLRAGQVSILGRIIVPCFLPMEVVCPLRSHHLQEGGGAGIME